MRENRMYGSMGGGWKRSAGFGDLRAGEESTETARQPDSATAPAAYPTGNGGDYDGLLWSAAAGGYSRSQFTGADVRARLLVMTPQDVDLPTLFDALYDASLETFGVPLSTGIFDRTRLIPLSELPQVVRSETGEVLPPQRIG